MSCNLSFRRYGSKSNVIHFIFFLPPRQRRRLSKPERCRESKNYRTENGNLPGQYFSVVISAWQWTCGSRSITFSRGEVEVVSNRRGEQIYSAVNETTYYLLLSRYDLFVLFGPIRRDHYDPETKVRQISFYRRG